LSASLIFSKKISNPTPFILHLEIQSGNDHGMLGRMQVYDALLYEKYGLSVQQYVLYIGLEKMKMPTSRQDGKKYFDYNLLDIRQFKVLDFLNSDIPELVILAILADFQSQKPEEIISAILTKLQKLAIQNLRLSKCIRQLEIIAKLRKLASQTLKQTTNMPIVIDITDDRFFKAGKAEAKREDIEGLLKFGKLNDKEIAEVLKVKLEDVLKIKKEMKK
jgi:hypothetical protein